VRERLDAGLEFDFSDVPVLAVAVIFKEFLRSLPDSVFPASMYSQFVSAHVSAVAAGSSASAESKLTLLKAALAALPPCNFLLLRAVFPMLHSISQQSAINQMTADNLGICIGQSLMWPSIAEDVVKNEVCFPLE
jgi:hypothetical protein